MGVKLTVEQLEEEKQNILRRMKMGKRLCYREPTKLFTRGYYFLNGNMVNGKVVKSLVKDGLIDRSPEPVQNDHTFYFYTLKQ